MRVTNETDKTADASTNTTKHRKIVVGVTDSLVFRFLPSFFPTSGSKIIAANPTTIIYSNNASCRVLPCLAGLFRGVGR